MATRKSTKSGVKHRPKARGRTGKNTAGRPSVYSEELADRICTEIIDGASLRTICAGSDMPDRGTVIRWMDRHPEFAAKYARARDLQAEHLEESMADLERQVHNGTADAKAARVVLESRRWRAMKLAPKRFGNRVAMDVEGRLTLEQLVAGTAAAADAQGDGG
jgi:hypothetical protein